MQDTTIVRPNGTTADDHDLYLEIATTASRCQNITFIYNHIKGHQDNDRDRCLTIPEQHNVDCDRFAKGHVKSSTILSTSYDNPEFEAAQLHLRIDGHVICRRFIPALHQAHASLDYFEYLRLCFNWTSADLKMIHWQALQLALQSFPRNDQHWLVLFIHDKLPLRDSKFHPHMGSHLCPSCQHETEDYWHFLECDHTEQRQLFEKLKQQLGNISRKHQLHPSVLTTFWLGLLAIRHHTPYPEVQHDLAPTTKDMYVSSMPRMGSTLPW